TGLTTIQGRTPQSFDAQILGVLPDFVLPGLDVILVKLSGPVIDQTGGVFFGMSGSPVSINGQLVGAIAYGPPGGYGDHTIAGLTPAADMLKVLDYPAGSQAASTRTFAVPRAWRIAAARVARESASSVPGSLTQLRTPV